MTTTSPTCVNYATVMGPPTGSEADTPTPPPTGTAAGRPVTVRMVDIHDRIVPIRLLVRPVAADLDEIRYSDHTVGYVQRADRTFVALVGSRADRAEECGQYLLWDLAATRLVSVQIP